MPGSFKTIGNLAFYDGWSPEYFYFNTLMDADEVNDEDGYWDARAAQQVAIQAIAEANAKEHLGGLKENDAMEQMSERFNQIAQFLDTAYEYELSNETKYFKQKYEKIKENFTEEEIQGIKPLADLLSMFKDGISAVYNYDEFITLINVIMQGIRDTKTIAKYEADRIIEIDSAVKKLISSRGEQTRALGYKRGKIGKELEESVAKSENKLKRKIEIEYLTHGNLSGKHQTKSGKQSYNIWGYKKYFSKIKHTVDVELAHWTTRMLHDIMNDPQLLRQFANKLQANYPADGNFWALEADVKHQIIMVVQQKGLKDLQQILKKRVAHNTAQRITREILKDKSLFDASQSYDIKGLNPNYGMYGLTLKLFEEATSISDLAEGEAKQLYEAFDRLEKDRRSKFGITREQDFLLQVFKKNKSLTAIEDMRALIKRLEKIQKKLDKYQQQLNKNLIRIDEINGKTLSAGSSADTAITFTMSVIDGTIVLEADENGNSRIGQIIRNTSDFRRFGFKKFNPNSLKNAIKTLKSRASLKLRDNLVEGLEASFNKNTFGLTDTEMLEEVKQGFQNLRVSIGGPKLSELASAIHFSQSGGDLIIDWMGGLNGKNDVITMTINIDDVASHINFNFEDGITRIVTDVTEPEIMKAREEFLAQWNEDFKASIVKNTQDDALDKYSNIGKQFLSKLEDFDKWSTNLQEKYIQLEMYWNKYKEELKRAGVNDEEIEQKRLKFLNVLGDSFYVSTTVKTYNDYQNNIGFLGGSLGTNLDSQLSRIADIFSQCGLSIDNDLEWLKFAIINCSPLSLFGTSQKNLIENYLGSVAALALFDEGGAEGEIIRNFSNHLDQAIQSTSSPGILHLYKVNGLYVPGSYVLQQVIKTIKTQVIPQIQSIPDTMKRGAGITIINGASTSMIPNRPIAETDNPDTAAWKTTGQAVKASVSLQILFLAGLLDIANGINKTLGSLELPG